MTNIFKKVIYFFSLLILVIVLIDNKSIINAKSDDIKVNFIFDNLNYFENDTIELSLNITNGHNIKEIKLGISKGSNNTYYEFEGNAYINKSSGFTKEVINNVTNDDGLRLYLQKEKECLEDKICTVKLHCQKDINNIITLINENITIYLFDEENKLLDYKIEYSEKLKATWNILLDELEVYSQVPDYTSSFFVSNRMEDEYEILLKQNIDSSIVGTQVISIIVIDKINNDYLLFNKTINVVDKTIPCLTFPDEITISDIEIDMFSLDEYIKIIDNYDENAYIIYSYYNKEEESLDSLQFVEYLKHNKKGYVSFYGIDKSQNKTEEIKIEINVEDVTAPVITTSFVNDLVIEDIELDTFELSSCFSIYDGYDKNPKLIIEVYDSNNELIEKYQEKLLETKSLKLKYYGIDNSNNKTSVVDVNIILKDTLAPIIKGKNDVIIKDFEITDNFYLNDLDYYDNIDKFPVLESIFYIDEEKVNKYIFLEKIKKGFTGCVLFQAIDSENNASGIFTKKIKVVDTTPPTINLVNIKDGGKYLKVEQINYEITDNFNGLIDVYVLVNGYEYNNTIINEVGIYEVVIYAKDSSGNESKKEFSFTIIENNIEGCNNDVKCYVENYLHVIVVVTVLTICTVALVIVKIIVEKKKEKNKIKEIKNENI